MYISKITVNSCRCGLCYGALYGLENTVLYFEGAFSAEYRPAIALRAEIIREQQVAASHFAPPCVKSHDMEIQ